MFLSQLQSEILSKSFLCYLRENSTTLLSNVILYNLFTKKKLYYFTAIFKKARHKGQNYCRCTWNQYLYKNLILERENWLHVQKALRLKNYPHLNVMAVFLLLCPAPFPSSHIHLVFVIKRMWLLCMACILDCCWGIYYVLTDVTHTDLECRVGQGPRTVPGYRSSVHVLCYLPIF